MRSPEAHRRAWGAQVVSLCERDREPARESERARRVSGTCACVRARERERDRGAGDLLCVCVCVCVSDREREREREF